MRNAALERDDSIMPFSFLVSLLGHGMILFLIVFPRQETRRIFDHVMPSTISYQILPGAQEFLRFSPTERIFTTLAGRKVS